MQCCCLNSKTMTTATKVRGGTTLLLIDVQKDFHPGGSLAIEAAGADAERITDIIRRSIADPDSPSINRLMVTLDSHHKLHIAHPKFWESGHDGKPPPPFTIISSSDIKKGTWKPRSNLKLPLGIETVKPSMLKCKTDEYGNLNLLDYCIEYTKALEEKGRFKLCIWPEHCLMGTKGHQVVDDVSQVMGDWSDLTGGSIEFVMKGQNLLTEMYSALAAEVPITTQTDYNDTLLFSLSRSDRLLIVGQAMSHCVNYTTRDIIAKWPKGELHKICVVTDCMSPVPGFEKDAEEFTLFLKEKGISTCLAADVFNNKNSE